jgi:hypothetical protein
VLLSTPLHASSNFTVSVQLADKRGFTKIFLYENIPFIDEIILWVRLGNVWEFGGSYTENSTYVL